MSEPTPRTGSDPGLTILAPGSRGDVAPCVALASALHEQYGYRVRVVAHPSLRFLVQTPEIDFWPLSSFSREEVEEAVASLYGALARPIPSPSRVREAWGRFAANYNESLVRQCLEACEGSRAVLFTIIDIAGLTVAEKLGIPSYPLYSSPVTRSGHMAHTLFLPFVESMYPLNYVSHLIGEQLAWQPFRPLVNRARKALGLAPMPWSGPFGRLIRQELPIFYHYSEALLPKPRDWPAHAHVTGYWFLDPVGPSSLPATLLEFLDRGPAPIYVNFGSVSSLNSEARIAQVLAGAKSAGVRVLLEAPEQGIDVANLPPEVFRVSGDVPHVSILPRVSAVVHHGGVGTTHAALRAGVPSVICPALGDQFLWGSRVSRMGVGPPIVSPRRFGSEAIAAAIRRAVTDSGIAARAAEIGRRVRAEDGAARAARALRPYLEEPEPRPTAFGALRAVPRAGQMVL